MTSPTIDTSRRSKRGPYRLPDDGRRVHSISVRVTVAELAKVDRQRAPVRMQRGEYLRCAALHRLPPTIPAVNETAAIELSRAATSLNQIAYQLNRASQGAGITPAFAAIRTTLDQFRRALIGLETEA